MRNSISYKTVIALLALAYALITGGCVHHKVTPKSADEWMKMHFKQMNEECRKNHGTIIMSNENGWDLMDCVTAPKMWK